MTVPVESGTVKLWRRHPDLNWGIEVLQTSYAIARTY